MYKRRRVVGTCLGVLLAALLLPGITPVVDDGPWWPALVAALAFLIVNQLIHTYPSDIRGAPPLMVLILAAVGVVQDTLIWLLVSWLDFGLEADGFVSALLGGVIVRLAVLVLLPFGPRPVAEAA